MNRSAIVLAVALSTVLVVPSAHAKISVPVGGKTLSAGQRVVVRVPGCSSAKPCRWASGVVIVLTRQTAGTSGKLPTRGLLRLAAVSTYGMLRFRLPQQATGEYQLVAVWPRGGAPTWASAPFQIVH